MKIALINENSQAARLQLLQGAQNEVVLQRLLLVSVVMQLISASIRNAAKWDVCYDGVVLLIGRCSGHALEGRHGGGVARAGIHQAIDAP